MKVIIPVAGLGSRLKPHTFTTPKSLMDVAGMPILRHIINKIIKLNPSEIILIVGYKKLLIEKYFKDFFPKLKIKFIEQKKTDGDGSAIRLGLEDLKKEKDEDLMIIFGDTLIDFNLKSTIKKNSNSDIIIFGMEVNEPKHYGIMEINSKNEIISVEEKPENPKSNLAIIGAYYFNSSYLVKKYLNEFYEKKEKINGEYKIIQIIEKLIDKNNSKLKIKASKVENWFDCGRPEVLLEANKYFLKKFSNLKIQIQGNNLILPPSFISKSSKIENSIIGPFASIGDNVEISNSIIKNSIININSKIKNKNLKNSLIGKQVILEGKNLQINIGDYSELYFN